MAKLKGKDFYKKMLDAKKAKADKVKREKPVDKAPEVRPELPDTPKKPVDVTMDTPASRTEENSTPSQALERALQRIEQQAKGL